MSKKLLSLLLCLALLLALVPAALAEDIALVEIPEDALPNDYSGSCGETVTWVLKDGTLTVSGTGAMEDYSWNTAPWYAYRDSITSVVVENGVTELGEHAFNDLNYLTAVSLAESVTFLSPYVFAGSRLLTEISLPAKLEVIGTHAFFDSGLGSVTIPASVFSVDSGAFGGCLSLTEIKVASGSASFQAKKGVLFSKNGEELVCYPAGKTAASYTVPAGVKTLNSESFSCVGSLTKVTLPAGLEGIGYGAFSYCGYLEEINLPEGLTLLAASCFQHCYALKEITIPASVTSIYEGPFAFCSSLSAIRVAEGNARYRSEEGVLFDSYTLSLLAYPCSKPESSYRVPGDVQTIAAGAFAFSQHLQKLTVGAGVTGIGAGAFSHCFALTTVRFEGSAPDFEGESVFGLDEATVYYPMGDESWTREVRQNYGGTLTWLSWTPLNSPGLWVEGMSTGGIRLKWIGCEEATIFDLQRKAPGGDWVSLRQIQGDSYTNTDVVMGVTYRYRVRGLVYSATDDYDSPWSNELEVLFNPFADVSGKKTVEYVAWAYNNGIIKGVSSTGFSPDEPCTRVEFIMMLWKMHGSPIVSGTNPFTDVSGSKTAKAIVWALDKGIINSGSRFNPDGRISRIQVVMILWKLAGSPKVMGDNPFQDVSGSKTVNAVLWAYQSGITKGTSKTTFSPDDDCSRVQLVVFLYKYNQLYGVI